jgi:hypothetical protein
MKITTAAPYNAYNNLNHYQTLKVSEQPRPSKDVHNRLVIIFDTTLCVRGTSVLLSKSIHAINVSFVLDPF